MQWSNQVWIKPVFKVLVLFSPLLFIIGFYRNISFLFLLGLFILFFYGSTLLQFKSAAQDLNVEHVRQVYRLFPGDSDAFSVKLLHKGFWPSFRGEIFLTHKNIISSSETDHSASSPKGRSEVKRPFAIYRKTAYTEKVSFVALKRGTTRISNVALHIHDPLQTSGQSLTFRELFPTEIIVYPKPLPVQRIEHLFYQGTGETSRPFALFENVSLPAGNRDYAYGDSFHKLHWKATARTGTLQTKVFEKTVVYHWTFVYTIRPDHKDMRTADEIENEISYLAFMCQFAAEKGIPFEVYINFKVPGPLGMYHVPTDSGPQHLSKVLEGLSRIDRSNVTLKPEYMWTMINRNFAGKVPFVILLGHIPNDEDTVFMTKRWMRAGGKIFSISQSESEAFLMPYMAQEVIPC